MHVLSVGGMGESGPPLGNGRVNSTIKPVKIEHSRRSPTWSPPLALRLGFLVFAGVSVVAGLLAGTVRLGYLLDSPAASLAQDHGALMVFGFVGGAIGIERAVAVRARWAWLGPLAHALGVLTTLAGLPRPVPGLFFALSFLVLGAIYREVHRRQATFAVLTQAAGVIGGVAAAVLWGLGLPFAYAMPFAVVFSVATIIGERLELARVSFGGAAADTTVTALVLALTASALLFGFSTQLGFALMGVLLVLVALATVRVDVARHLVKSRGLPRYSAVCMLLGYVWLVVGGVIWVAFGFFETGFAFDAGVHAIFLGFVLSMILAHAPIILTSVIRYTLPYHPVMYAAVALLHAGLLIRLLADARSHTAVWQAGGLVNVTAVSVFLVLSFTLTVRHARRQARRHAKRRPAARSVP